MFDLVAILDFQDGFLIKYLLNEPTNEQNLQAFFDDFRNKKLKNYYRLKKLPSEQGAIQEVNTQNFSEEMQKRERMIFYFFREDD